MPLGQPPGRRVRADPGPPAPSPETSLGTLQIAGGGWAIVTRRACCLFPFPAKTVTGRDTGEDRMFAQIFKSLDDMDACGAGALEAARMGFLEWALSLDGDIPADQAARNALARLPRACDPSPAAEAFLDYLMQAALPRHGAPKRRGGRRRILN